MRNTFMGQEHASCGISSAISCVICFDEGEGGIGYIRWLVVLVGVNKLQSPSAFHVKSHTSQELERRLLTYSFTQPRL